MTCLGISVSTVGYPILLAPQLSVLDFARQLCHRRWRVERFVASPKKGGIRRMTLNSCSRGLSLFLPNNQDGIFSPIHFPAFVDPCTACFLVADTVNASDWKLRWSSAWVEG